MRTIIEYCLVSADGIFDDPDPIQMGLGAYQDAGYLRDSVGIFEAADAILWGRSTFERFAQIYGKGGGNSAYGARLNEIPKYVFSSTLKTAEWNNSTIVRGDVVAEVTKLKQQVGGSLLVLGHGRFGETLLKQGLTDVLDLSIHPLLVGRGKPLFRDGQAAKLKLVATKSFSQIVKLSYEVQH